MSALRAAGSGVVGNAGLSPANSSMYETSLRSSLAEQFPRPEMKNVAVVQKALQRDVANQRKKYGGSEPNSVSARFTVELPQGTQNSKYCWLTPGQTPRMLLNAQSPTLDTTTKVAPLAQAGCRFNKQTLQSWFMEVDKDGSGTITQREFIVGMRQRPELLEMFCGIKGCSPIEFTSANVEGQIKYRREEMYRIKETLREVDTDGSGTMEWEEFVEFFRKAGLLLEYQTDEERNRTDLCGLDTKADKVEPLSPKRPAGFADSAAAEHQRQNLAHQLTR